MKAKPPENKLPSIVSQYGTMWPRELFDHKIAGPSGKPINAAHSAPELDHPGVYILYREDVPYYIGKANKLRKRLYNHARKPGSKHDLFWNYFSFFVVQQLKHRDELEALLILAFPTANAAKPQLEEHVYSDVVRHIIRRKHAGVLLRSKQLTEH